MNRTPFLLAIFLFAFSACSISGQTNSAPEFTKAQKASEYPAAKSEAAAALTRLQTKWKQGTARAELLKTAKKQVPKMIVNDLVPHWYGTTWAFSGTTQTPQKGEIACGYFVTTLLRDAGFKVERVRMAQQASLNIIRSLTPRDQIRDYSRISTAELKKRVEKMPEGLFVVGLDIHTGFIYHGEGDVWFIHSSYGNPAVVVCERAAKSAVLAQSNRFVLGRIDNDWLLKKYLAGEAITTVR
ncbi:MAG: hypothetical protein AAF570_04440 [Bacteroidota bacterium]